MDLAIPELKSLLTKQSDETIMKQLCDSDMVAGLLTCRAMTQEGAGYYTFTDAEMKDPKVLVRLQQVAADYVSAAANLQPAPRRSPLAAYLEVLHCGRHVTPPVVEKIFASGEMFARDSMKWATAAPLRSLSRVVVRELPTPLLFSPLLLVTNSVTGSSNFADCKCSPFSSKIPCAQS